MDKAIAHNIAVYSRRATKYDRLHPEIFNDVEQERLRAFLGRAVEAITSGGTTALDFGCGSGNLTRHLRNLGLDVTAADVTPAFLDLVNARYDVPVIEMPDGKLDGIPDGSFDLIAMYSVLHHIPDYETVLTKLVGKLKVGGVLVIEHEHLESHYFPTEQLAAFRAENHEATRKGVWDPEHKRWQHLLRAAVSPKRHWARYLRLRGIAQEGDIHVHPHDHIEWTKVNAALEAGGAKTLERDDHLLFVGGYDAPTWRRWRSQCADQVALMAQRR